jgi:hypothetical protein
MDKSEGRPVYGMIDDVERRKGILLLALHNYTSKDLTSYHHWPISCRLAVAYVEQLEATIANMDAQRAAFDPVNRRTLAELVP